MSTQNFSEKKRLGLRSECKYIISPGIFEIFSRRCKAVLKTDKHAGESGEYRVTSLYFDDMFRNAYKEKLNGVERRRKFRIRAYNLSPERITLEAKFKEGDHVRKESTLLTYDEYKAILRGDFDFCLEADGKGVREGLREFYVYAKTANPKPAAITDYIREAYIAEAGNTRITFDKNISAGFDSADMFKAKYAPAMENSGVVLEIKFDEFLPPYIKGLFTGFPLMMEPVSKYLLCANNFSEESKRCQIQLMHK